MGQRNISSSSQMINLENDLQAQFPFHPQPCVFSGTYPQPVINPMLPVAEPLPGFVPHHLSGNCENAIPYGMTNYNGVHHHLLAGNPGLGPVTSNYYNPYMTPGSSVFPSQVNLGPQFVDGFGGAFKRKNAEGYPGDFQYSNSVAGPSSAVPLTMEVGPQQQGVRPGPIGGEPVLANNTNHLVRGNYQGPALIPANAPWLEQRFSGNGGDGGAWSWSQAPGIPYVHGNGVNGGFAGPGNMVAEQRYPEAAANGSSSNYQLLPPVYQQGRHPNLHHLMPPVQQGALYSHVPPAGPSSRPQRSSNNLHHPFQDGMGVARGLVGPIAPTGFAVYHSHGRGFVPPEATMRRHGLPRLNLLPTDEVAMLEIPGYYGMGNAVDQHLDMRLDVDNMSYEELLALGDHIGYVTTGLPENTISNQLKTRNHISSTTSMDLEDQETDFCAICQTNYENQEKIGTLDCGHEYHADCVKRWLVIKNICPICKSSALSTKRKDFVKEG